MSVFKEAQQFKGVFADPTLVAAADRPGVDQDTAARLRATPPLSRDVSLKFSDGTVFDVQQDDSGQYLCLSPEKGTRVRVNVGEWVCQLASGRFIKLTDAEYKDMSSA